MFGRYTCMILYLKMLVDITFVYVQSIIKMITCKVSKVIFKV